MLGKGGQRAPQIVQQQSGPSMQEIEQAMDQMMGQALEQCRLMYDSRIVALEGLVEQQQVQLQQLQQISVLDTRLSQLAHEVSSLHLDHTVAKDDGQAVFECLIGSGLIPAPQLQARRRSCQCLSAFCSLMESKDRKQAMEGLAGDRDVARLYAVSRSFLSARRAATEKPQPAKVVEELDEEIFQELKDYEPPRAELDRWEKSVTVHTLLGLLKVEGLICKTDVLKYGDVYKLFSQLGLTLDQFVDKFTRVRRSRTAEELEEMAGKVLARFSSQRSAERKDVISCRDLYRLLEIVGYPLAKFKTMINGAEEPEQPQQVQKLGGYKIRSPIGQGRNSVCYLGESLADQARVAIKWPAPRDELAMLKDVQRAAPKGCLGVPKLLAHGESQREPYFVTELLGSPLSRVFQGLDAGSTEQRWPALCLMGRLALRRLKALHGCGFVHCDVSPENLVLGVSREQSNGTACYGLYLVDFEHAQKHPGGRALGSDCGSAEWSSIRCAEGGERLPEDDLEALGWVLMNGFFGDLPWFPWLTAAYKEWDSQWTRHQVIKQAQVAKRSFLAGGWRAFACRKSLRVPAELAAFIPACQAAPPGKPDYAKLLTLLGGSADAGSEEAEREDVSQFTKLLAGL